MEAEEPAMAVDLEKLNQDVRTPDGFMIEPVTDAATMKERNGFIGRLGAGEPRGTQLMNGFCV